MRNNQPNRSIFLPFFYCICIKGIPYNEKTKREEWEKEKNKSKISTKRDHEKGGEKRKNCVIQKLNILKKREVVGFIFFLRKNGEIISKIKGNERKSKREKKNDTN